MHREEILYAEDSTDALALGFELDTDYYGNIRYVNEKVTVVYVTDDSSEKRLCGLIRSQNLYATHRDKYLTNYQQDVWLTRTITEPTTAKCKVNSWLNLKKYKSIDFSVSKVVENDAMPNGVKLSSYMATSPSQVINKSVTSGWSINGSTSISSKKVSVGIGSGVTWSSKSDIILCTTYNESRQDRFKVTFNLLDPYYNTMTEKQRSYCYNLNYFYTAKHTYGTPEIMARCKGKTTTEVEFIGHYTYAGLGNTSVRTLKGRGSISVLLQ